MVVGSTGRRGGQEGGVTVGRGHPEPGEAFTLVRVGAPQGSRQRNSRN